MRKIIIDTDPGIDDAIAILLALSAKKELDVLALTTVNGNVDVEKVTKNACKILEVAGRTDIPVYKGMICRWCGPGLTVKNFMEMTAWEMQGQKIPKKRLKQNML